jgi:UDP-N-acetylglucosamine acyltransferase
MSEIHPTALIDRRAELAADVSVGAYSVIKAGVTVASGTAIAEHCIIDGNTIIGNRCQIGPAAYLGLPPQHLKFDGKGSFLILGNEVIVREMVSAHRSIKPGIENATRIGNRCMLMGGSHVGHDCQMGEDIILANTSLLGGHVIVGDRVFVGGGATVHQFVRIGRLSIISGNEALTHDVPPFAAMRYRGLKGYNAIGCKRSGMSTSAITAIRSAFRRIHKNRTVPAAVESIRREVPQLPEIREILDFLTSTKRGILPSLRFRADLMDSPVN